MNNEHEVLPFSHPDVQEYLLDYDATREERRCLMMWIHDGHSHLDNDLTFCLSYELTDFFGALYNRYPLISGCTESFYDPETQKYFKAQNVTEYEMRKLREYARKGYRFDASLYGPYDLGNNLLLSLRYRKETFEILEAMASDQ